MILTISVVGRLMTLGVRNMGWRGWKWERADIRMNGSLMKDVDHVRHELEEMQKIPLSNLQFKITADSKSKSLGVSHEAARSTIGHWSIDGSGKSRFD